MLVDNYFAPSIPKSFELTLKEFPQEPNSDGRIGNRSFNLTVLKKVQFICDSIEENWGEVIVYSDCDVQFFGCPISEILSCLSGKDIVFQQDSPRCDLCSGFFAMHCNRATLKLWQLVHKRLRANLDQHDQAVLNSLVFYSSRLTRLLGRFGMHLKGPLSFLKFGLLPDTFFTPGRYTAQVWTPGMDIELPKSVIVHHANWTVGVKNKIAQLEFVKSKVKARLIEV